VVCSLETSSQLARPGVNCRASGDVLTPLPLMSIEKAEDSAFGLLEGETGFAVCFTTQLSLVVRLLQEKIEAAKSSVLATKKTNARPHAHISCPASVRYLLLPLPLRLDMLHRTGPLPRYSPRNVYERSNIQMQGAWHGSIDEIVRSSGTQAAGKSSHRRAKETCAQSPC